MSRLSVLSSWCLWALLAHTSDAYRVNQRKLMSSSAKAQLQTDTVENQRLMSKQQASLAYWQGGSQRTAGNLLAAVGLMRANVVLGVSSKVLPSALLQDPVTPEIAGSGWGTAAKLSGGLACVAALVFGASRVVGSRSSEKADEEFNQDLMTFGMQGLRLVIPNVLATLLFLGNEVISTVCIGRVGTSAQLAAVGLSNMMMNCLVMSVAFGLNNPMDALVSQAYGSGKMDVAVLCFQRARLLGVMQIIWIFPVLYKADSILIALGQEEEVAANAATYCKVAGFTYIPVFLACAGSWFLRNVGVVLPGVYFLAAGNVVHLVACLLFTVSWGWGNEGIAASYLLNYLTVVTLMYSYLINMSKVSDYGFSKLLLIEPAAFTGLRDYCRLGVPAVINTAAEFWYWEFNTLMLGTLGKTVLAAHVATINFQATCMMLGMGMAGATATVIGTVVGSGKSRVAQTLSWVAAGSTTFFWAPIAVFILFNRNQIAAFYSQDLDVQELQASLLLFILVSGFFNSAQMTLGGALKGMGMHKVTAIAVFVGYYVCALPLGYALTFPMGMGVYGVYASFVTGTFLVAVLCTIMLYRVDFQQVCEAATARMKADSVR